RATGRVARRPVTTSARPPLSAQPAPPLEVPALDRPTRQPLLDFEPGILPATLRVRALETAAMDHHNVIGVEISGQLWAEPLPLEMLLRTEIDLETGQVEVADLAPTRVV